MPLFVWMMCLCEIIVWPRSCDAGRRGCFARNPAAAAFLLSLWLGAKEWGKLEEAADFKHALSSRFISNIEQLAHSTAEIRPHTKHVLKTMMQVQSFTVFKHGCFWSALHKTCFKKKIIISALFIFFPFRSTIEEAYARSMTKLVKTAGNFSQLGWVETFSMFSQRKRRFVSVNITCCSAAAHSLRCGMFSRAQPRNRPSVTWTWQGNCRNSLKKSRST